VLEEGPAGRGGSAVSGQRSTVSAARSAQHGQRSTVSAARSAVGARTYMLFGLTGLVGGAGSAMMA
jgi:hypothetical protein